MTGFRAARRAATPELMDSEPCGYDEFRACLRDLAAVNRVTLGHRPTLGFLERLRRGGAFREARAPWIVDVGCGDGEALRQVARWARRHGVAPRLTGIDVNPLAARAARAAGGDAAIEWVTADVFAWAERSDARPDIVLSALFAHHLDDAGVVRLLRWMEAVAAIGWFVNDLHRRALAYWGFMALARVAGWHRFVRHDGPVSVARAFRPAEWRDMLAAAGIAPRAATIERRFPYRLCVAKVKGDAPG